MPIVFKAVLHSYRTDSEGEGRLTLSLPSSEQQAGMSVSTKTKRVLYVTICEETEVQA